MDELREEQAELDALDREYHDERMEAAKARAEWELGDASWAGIIVGAYLYPRSDGAALRLEKESDV